MWISADDASKNGTYFSPPFWIWEQELSKEQISWLEEAAWYFWYEDTQTWIQGTYKLSLFFGYDHYLSELM